MNNRFQPQFQNISGAASSSEYDNLSEEELTKLINAVHSLKTGRQGSLAPARPPTATRVVDLDAMIERGKQ